MKMIVGSFQFEANSFTSIRPKAGDFEYFEGEDIFKKLDIKDLLGGFDVVPCIYANALPSGVLPRELYDRYTAKILDTVQNNKDADGIFLAVHGSMEVEGIGSGELYLAKKIREIIGKNCLIAMSKDLHANIHTELTNYVDIICGYKTAPHTDQTETQRRAVKILTDSLKNGKRPSATIVKVPMLIAGDTMLTSELPLKPLIALTRELEKEVLSVSLFFSHMWVDNINTCASVVVTDYDQNKALACAKKMAEKFFASRHDYKFLVEAESPEDCVLRAIEGKENRIFITDSGDNTTAGAEGDRLDLLKLLYGASTDKKICVAGITSKDTVEACEGLKAGAPVRVDGLEFAFKKSGRILGWAKEDIGKSVTLSHGNLDVIFTEKRSAFISKENFEYARHDVTDYNIVVVKLGYLFDELKPYSDRALFAMTEGSSCVDIFKLNLKKIPRPMFPLDRDIQVEF